MDLTLDAWGRLSREGLLGARQSVAPPPGAAQTARVSARDWKDEDRPKTASSCHVRELGGEKVVYDPETHEVVVLNRTAAFIFDLCDGSRTVAELEAALCARYAAPRAVLRRDLEATLASLGEKHVLA
jgi:hypothetical protein